MKVIIAGGRKFNDYSLLSSVCDHMLQNQEEIEIVSGTAGGADRLGERYAEEKGYKLTKFPADWEKFGKGAGYIRNKQMAEYADALIVFWDGESSGTKHMINLAKKEGIKVKIVRYENK
jgi:Protein of unknown function (DUF2493).